MRELRGVRRAWDRITIYLPVILMGFLAMGTYWLARSTPSFAPAAPERAPTHEADYFLRGFSVKSFDAAGRLKSEVQGTEARHYPDTDTLEIDNPRVRAYNEKGALTTGTGKRGISNADGTQVQLIGDAVVTHQATAANGQPQPKLEIRGEFLHAYTDQERVTSNQPVTLIRGNDVFHGDSLDYDNLERQLQMQGRVRGTIQPGDTPR